MTMTTELAVPTAPYWTLADIAVVLGVTYNSARTYHGRAEITRNHLDNPRATCRLCREQGHVVLDSDLPPPDRRIGRSPVWYPSTIQEWVRGRPGKGGGR